MVGNNNQTSTEDVSYLRKIRKPLIEKRRRERMNHSITQLRALIGDTIKQNTAPMTRVDKADVLELTVCHLTKLRHQQVTSSSNDRHSYTAGYQDCSRHVIGFLLSNGLVDSNKAAEISYHLQTSLGGMQTQSVPSAAQTSTPNHRVQSISNTISAMPALRKISPISTRVHYEESPCFKSNLTNSIASPTMNFASYIYSPMSLQTAGRTNMTANTSSSSNEESSQSLSFFSSSDEIHNETGTVSIGTGSENKIGHVIQETTWRPW